MFKHFRPSNPISITAKLIVAVLLCTTTQLPVRADASYMARIQHRVKRVWIPAHGSETKTSIVTFKIHKDGHISFLRLLKPSGDARTDQAALHAIEDSLPFYPLPEGFPDPIDVEFRFDYQYLKGTIMVPKTRI